MKAPAAKPVKKATGTKAAPPGGLDSLVNKHLAALRNAEKALALIDHKSGSEYLKKMFSSAGQRRVAFGAEVFRNERSDLGCRRPQAGQ